jgi:phosphoribosylglycinamide formyltransferase 1
VSFAVAVLVSGEGSNLQAILDDLPNSPDVEIVAVASNRAGARALERARAAGVETAVFEAAAYSDRGARDEALAAWLEQRRVDLVVLAGFMEILSSGFVRRFHKRMINVHPSLLPAFPGVRAIEQAVAYGVRVMGVTVHFVDEGVDSGPIVLQESFDAVPYARDIGALERRIHEIEHRLLPRAVRLLASGAVHADPHNSRRVTIEEDANGDD